MKRTIPIAGAFALLLSVTSGSAWAADVISSNVVGYNKVNLVNGYNMVGPQFVQVGGDNLKLSTVGQLDDTFDGFDEEGEYAVKLLAWSAARQGYTTYGWSGTSPEDFEVVDDDSLNNKWLNDDFEEPIDSVSPQAGFWVQADKAGSFTVSGEVPTNKTVTVSLVAGYNLVANPFPVSAKIASFGTLDSSYEGFDDEGEYAVKLLTWSAARQGYTTYGWSGTSPEDFEVVDDDSLNNKWLNDDFEDAGDEVGVGLSVWIQADHAGTITFTNPIP